MKIAKKIFNYMFIPDENSSFEQEFSHEILKSEKSRSIILLVLFMILGGGFCVTYLFFKDLFPGEVFTKIKGIPFMLWMAIIVAAAAFYELLFFFVISFFIRRKYKFPLPPRFANAIVEVSIPTIIILLASFHFNSYEALFMPIVFFYFIFIALSALRLSFFLCFFTGAVASIEYIVLALYLIGLSAGQQADTPFMITGVHVTRGMIMLLAGMLTGFVAYQIRNRLIGSLHTLEERNRIKSVFGQHVSPEVVDELIDREDSFISETRNVCVMFLDIRGFTGFSEKKTPQEVVNFLNYLFDFMIEIINRNNGIINKFLGDGFMALFGAPLSDGRDIEHAVTASLEIISRLTSEVKNGFIPDTRIGIGLHAGEAVTGSVGSSVRKEYTIIGDVVNMASRIEQLNKKYESSLLVTDVIWREVKDICSDSTDLGLVNVRGHNESVHLYKLA